MGKLIVYQRKNCKGKPVDEYLGDYKSLPEGFWNFPISGDDFRKYGLKRGEQEANLIVRYAEKDCDPVDKDAGILVYSYGLCRKYLVVNKEV